ncbi:MAG TPA: formimidoylglutamate deiminase [Pyrinomonadaceae bacterium]|nr:formimidoylglutamate deiminase [Pyrinomonadaceae bacterium]
MVTAIVTGANEIFRLNGIPGVNIAWVPDLIYVNNRFERGMVLFCDALGRIVALQRVDETKLPDDGKSHNIALPGAGLVLTTRFTHLRGRALMPGLVNAHSHAFQRVIRGRTEYRSTSSRDSFWTWREMMYSAAARLTPEDIYDASRMAFLEMALSGITAVGEFHYLHHSEQGTPYEDPNLLAKQVVRAARDVGLRIALLSVAYARSGFRTPPNERQARFIESDPQKFLRRVDDLQKSLPPEDELCPRSAWASVAPHSVRAVPLPYLREVSDFAAEHQLPLHMHVAEQPAEVTACVAEYGRTPVALLADEGLLNPRFTGVHAIHVTPDEIASLAVARARICACPTTERNLGDGIIPADEMFRADVRVALGSDSHTQIDLLEDARALEYHLRLQKLERNVLAPPSVMDDSSSVMKAAEKDASEGADFSSLAARLFECATINGAASINSPGGELAIGRPADFFTVDLQDSSIAGASDDDLLPTVLFSLARTAIRDVVVGGRSIVEEGRHNTGAEIVERFTALQQKLWGNRQ